MEIVREIYGGKDGLFILATDAGKSLCFQFPAALERHEMEARVAGQMKTTIVISPLVALIEEQNEKLLNSGFNSIRLAAGSDDNDNVHRQFEFEFGQNTLNRGNDVDFIFLTPEKLFQNQSILAKLRRAL